MRLGTLRLHESPDPDALLRAAERLGIAGIDTADVYGTGPPHETERRLSTGLPVQTKVGLIRTATRWQPRGTARHLTTAVVRALAHLDRPDVLLHAIDPATPAPRSYRALTKLRDAGTIGRIGVCNARHHEIRELLELGVDVVQVPLSPFHRHPLESGVVRLCLEHGIEVQAHSPLGGWRRKNHVHRDLKPIARAHGISGERLTLAWLTALGVVPIVGCTRVETLEDAVGPVPEEAVQQALTAIPESSLASRRPEAEGDGHVVLVAGLPGAGKSTAARRWTARGYARLNRDALGGTLKGLVTRLDALLESGERRVVLDNTWADRHVRHRVVRVAAQHGCRVEAVHIDTPPQRCQAQIVRRILDDGAGLPEPEQLGGDPVHWFGPRVLFRFVDRFEPFTDDEGMAVSREPGPVLEWGEGAAHIVDLDALIAGEAPEAPVVVAWIPDAAARTRLDRALATTPVLAVYTCPHPPGPPRCWCRPPLPGLLVQAMRDRNLDPSRCSFHGGRALRDAAARLVTPRGP